MGAGSPHRPLPAQRRGVRGDTQPRSLGTGLKAGGSGGGAGSPRREPPSHAHAAPRLKPEILGPHVRAPETAPEVCTFLTALSTFVLCGLLPVPLCSAFCADASQQEVGPCGPDTPVSPL